MQENPESQEKKVTKGSFFEVPGVVKAESERGTKPERKTDVTRANSNLKENLKLVIKKNPGRNLKVWKRKSQEVPQSKR